MTKTAMPLSPQCADCLTELKQRPRTTLQLMRATGVIRVGAVIHNLRIHGFHIDTQIIEVRTRHRKNAFVALYTLLHKRGRVPINRKRTAAPPARKRA